MERQGERSSTSGSSPKCPQLVILGQPETRSLVCCVSGKDLVSRVLLCSLPACSLAGRDLVGELGLKCRDSPMRSPGIPGGVLTTVSHASSVFFPYKALSHIRMGPCYPSVSTIQLMIPQQPAFCQATLGGSGFRLPQIFLEEYSSQLVCWLGRGPSACVTTAGSRV